MTHSLIQFASASFFPPAIALVTIVRVAPSPPPSSSPPPLQAARVRDTTATPATAPSTFFLLMVVLHDRSDGFWAGRHAGAPRWRTEQLPLHRSEEHTSELQSRFDLVCRLLLEKT